MSREAINIVVIIIVGTIIIIIDISCVSVELSVGDAIKLGEAFQPGTVREEGSGAVCVMAYHGGLGGMGGENAMVVGVRSLEAT